jgi:hypothetical protein
LAEQFVCSVRRIDEAAVIGNFRLSGPNLTEVMTKRSSAAEREPIALSPCRRTSRTFDVGEKRPHVIARVSNSFNAASAFSRLRRRETHLLEQTRSVHAQKRVVFDYENHWPCLAHKTQTHQPRSTFLCPKPYTEVQ